MGNGPVKKLVCPQVAIRRLGNLTKYFRRNFLPGRTFVDHDDFQEQLTEWTVAVTDVRVHGTTHNGASGPIAEKATS